MQYRDLIYKITSGDTGVQNKDATATDSLEMNDAYTSSTIDAAMIGVVFGSEYDLSSLECINLKYELSRLLTFYFGSNSKKELGLLFYDISSIQSFLKNLPESEFNLYYTPNDDIELETIKALKLTHKNLKNLNKLPQTNLENPDFIQRIHSLVCVNAEIPSSIVEVVPQKSIDVIYLSFNPITTNTRQEKRIAVDRSGWKYNPSSGIWAKNFGNDGLTQIQGW